MRISSVVIGLALSVTIFVCVEPALGQRPRPIPSRSSVSGGVQRVASGIYDWVAELR